MPRPSTLEAKVDERPGAVAHSNGKDGLEVDMDDFSTAQAHDGAPDLARLGIGAPFEMLHADDNLGDEAPFPTTWQPLARAESPND